MDSYLRTALVLLALTVVQGFFVAAEIALVSARRSALQAAADRGSRGARTAVHLLDDPTRLLSTISVAITLVGFMASATAAVTFEEPVSAWLHSLGQPWLDRIAGGLSVVVVTAAITYVNLVFAELAPKRLGLQRAESVAGAVAGPVEWLSIAMAPAVWLLSRSTDVVARLLGVRGRGGKPGVTEEEIKLLVTEQGTLLDEEKRMIREVFELGDTVVREIMVPRVDAEMLEDTSTIDEALPVFEKTGFSRMPVYHEDPDTVVGIALLKDLVRPALSGAAGDPVARHAREPLFVPETKPILDLLAEMRRTHNHMAVVVDEHGGTAGLCTIEDIVEEVVGEISDEFDREHRFISRAGPDRWIVDGRLSAEEARDQLRLPVPESEEFETVAGWVLQQLGHIPEAGEHITSDGWTVRVLSVRRRRVARLLLVREHDGTAQED